MHNRYREIKLKGLSTLVADDKLEVTFQRDEFCQQTGDKQANKVESVVALGNLQAKREALLEELKDIDAMITDVDAVVEVKKTELTELEELPK